MLRGDISRLHMGQTEPEVSDMSIAERFFKDYAKSEYSTDGQDSVAVDGFI